MAVISMTCLLFDWLVPLRFSLAPVVQHVTHQHRWHALDLRKILIADCQLCNTLPYNCSEHKVQCQDQSCLKSVGGQVTDIRENE